LALEMLITSRRASHPLKLCIVVALTRALPFQNANFFRRLPTVEKKVECHWETNAIRSQTSVSCCPGGDGPEVHSPVPKS